MAGDKVGEDPENQGLLCPAKVQAFVLNLWGASVGPKPGHNKRTVWKEQAGNIWRVN